jgi:hypothetical protein
MPPWAISVSVFSTIARAQEKLKVHRMGELRRGTEAAVGRVKAAAQVAGGTAEQLIGQFALFGLQPHHRLEMIREAARLFLQSLTLLRPRLGDAHQHPAKRRQAVAVVRRKVSAAVERLEARREKHRHRPAAMPRHDLHRGHVNLVEVGAFLAVDLDADEVLVQKLADLRVLEALMLHDVAPVARGVADAEEDRPVQLAGLSQSFLAPGEPIDRVVGVLLEKAAVVMRETRDGGAHAAFSPS